MSKDKVLVKMGLGYMLKKITPLTLISLTLILMLFINNLTLKNYNHKIVKSVNNTINITEIKNELQVDKIQELQNYYDNKEIKAIITIDGLNNFNYPVVQTINNDYYLNHNYYKKNNFWS